jgi:hypothetical protein
MDLRGMQTAWARGRGIPTARTAHKDVVRKAVLNHIINHPNDLPRFYPDYVQNLETVKKALQEHLGAAAPVEAVEVLPPETDEQITSRWNKKLTSYEKMVQAVIDQKLRALSAFGNGGFGKTYIAMTALQRKYAEHEHSGLDVHWKWIKGGVSAIGLYRALFEMKDGRTLLIDDSDAVFGDKDIIGLLKSALDTTERRLISWEKEIRATDKDGEQLPRNFVFNGQAIFLSNIPIHDVIEKGTSISCHLEALRSRCHTIDMTVRTEREKLVVIRSRAMIIMNKLLPDDAFRPLATHTIWSYLEKKAKAKKLVEFSLRTVHKAVELYNAYGQHEWTQEADNSLCK